MALKLEMDSRAERSRNLEQALRLEYLTVGWNLLEGIIAVSAAIAANSVALLGFGIDSFVESASAGVLVWRLRAEQSDRDPERAEKIERRALKLVAVSLFLLAVYVMVDGARALWFRDAPEFSAVGAMLTGVSLLVMLFLARAKRRAAVALGSRALEADAFQTTACWWLSLATLGGVGLNGLFGWWWSDPAAALIVAALIAKEGREAWRGEECCD